MKIMILEVSHGGTEDTEAESLNAGDFRTRLEDERKAAWECGLSAFGEDRYHRQREKSEWNNDYLIEVLSGF